MLLLQLLKLLVEATIPWQSQKMEQYFAGEPTVLANADWLHHLVYFCEWKYVCFKNFLLFKFLFVIQQ